MSKNTANEKLHNVKPHLTTSDLTRQSIHSNVERQSIHSNVEDEDSCDEDNSPKKLYPGRSIKGELKEIKNQGVPNVLPRRHKSASTPKDDRPIYTPESVIITSNSSDFYSLKNILLYLLFSIVVLFFGINFFQTEKSAADKTFDLTKFISDMKNKFDEQDHQTFHILKTSLKRVVDENSKPDTPSIFTIITNKGAEFTASDFSNYIARELAYEHRVLINESAFHTNPDSLKYVIDKEIQSKFDNRSLNVAVVDKFHNIPIGAAMIFHSYCDHENAPFKRAIFLFIVHLNRKIPENSSFKVMDNTAMEALRSIWHDASDDMADSLITRLTGSVINIK